MAMDHLGDEHHPVLALRQVVTGLGGQDGGGGGEGHQAQTLKQPDGVDGQHLTPTPAETWGEVTARLGTERSSQGEALRSRRTGSHVRQHDQARRALHPC